MKWIQLVWFLFNAREVIHTNSPTPGSRVVSKHCFGDASLVNDLSTAQRQRQAAILIIVNWAPVLWYTKSSLYGGGKNTFAIKLVPFVHILVQNVLLQSNFGTHLLQSVPGISLEEHIPGSPKKITTEQNTNTTAQSTTKTIQDTPTTLRNIPQNVNEDKICIRKENFLFCHSDGEEN